MWMCAPGARPREGPLTRQRSRGYPRATGGMVMRVQGEMKVCGWWC